MDQDSLGIQYIQNGVIQRKQSQQTEYFIIFSAKYKHVSILTYYMFMNLHMKQMIEDKQKQQDHQKNHVDKEIHDKNCLLVRRLPFNLLASYIRNRVAGTEPECH